MDALIFLNEFAWALLILVGFGFAGLFAIIPFRKSFSYALLFAPLAGLLVFILSTSALYSMLAIPFFNAALIAYVGCVSLTLLSLYCVDEEFILFPDNKNFVFALLIFVGLMTYLTNFTSIYLGEPGFLYMDGTDHLSYAHLADWLKNHLVNEQPIASAMVPYQSWLDYVYRFDPRFGSYYTLTVFSFLRGQSGMFAYDGACTVVLAAGMLALGAVFARSRNTFFLLLIALLTSHWYDYSRHGFFGKILGYPASLFVVGLFLLTKRPFTLPQIALLVVFISAAVIMHSGLSTGLIFASIGGVFLVLRSYSFLFHYNEVSFSTLKEDLILYLFLIGAIIATMGVLPHPVTVLGPAFLDTTWYKLFPRLFDLETRTGGPHLANVKITGLFIGFVIMSMIQTYLLWMALRLREMKAATFILMTFLLLTVFFAKDSKWQADQLIGVFYPCCLFAAAILIDHVTIQFHQRRLNIFLGLFLIIVILHLPRLNGDITHYAGRGINHSLQYSQKEMRQLAKLIGHEKTTIDVFDRNHGIPLLVELGRTNPNLQWTPRAFAAVFAYRDWLPPKIDKTAQWVIQLKSAAIDNGCQLRLLTRQYQLVACNTSGANSS